MHKKLSFSFIVIVFLLDQASKLWIMNTVGPGQMQHITSFFNLVHVYNAGVSFGFLKAYTDYHYYILLGVISTVLLIIFLWWWRAKSKTTSFACALIIGGALGNIVDRIRLRAVFDFLDFHAFGYHWPAFNIADSAIVIGVCLLVFFRR